MGNVEKALSITDYFHSLPSSKYLIVAIVLLGIIFGILIDVQTYSGLNILTNGFIDGILLVALPSLLTATVIKIMLRKMFFRRILVTALAGEIIYAITYLAGFFVSKYDAIYGQIIIIIGAALVFVLWYAIAKLIFILKFRSFLFAVLQLFFHLMFFINFSRNSFSSDLGGYLFRFYFAAFLLLLGLYIFFMIVNAPMRRSFGINSTDAFSLIVAQWLYKDNNMEKTMDNLGENVKTLISVYSFQRENDKVLFVSPYVHFGPFGNLGGSEFSYLLSDKLSKEYNATTFVFHPTVTHDLNPVAATEIEKILKMCKEILGQAKYEKTNVSLAIGKQKECSAEALCFDNNAFISLTRAPLVTEDVHFGLGLAMIQQAQAIYKEATVVDQHNAETGEVVSFEAGSEIGFNYMGEVDEAINKKLEKSELEIGVSQTSVTFNEFGKAGIKVAIISTKPKYVMIWLDSNGITPEFREKIIKEMESIGKHMKEKWHAAVFTTDTHQANVVKGVLNPAKESVELLHTIKELTLKANKDISKAKFYADKKWIDIKVIGAKQSIELVSTVNAVVAVAKIVAPIVLLTSVVILYLIFIKFRL